MKRSIARKWAAALDSGEYTQCKGKLRKGDTFCCLGVLCNLHAQAHPEFALEQISKASYAGSNSTLPEVVIEWAGLYDENPYVNKYNEGLAGLNDTHGKTFPDLAKIIRKHWKEL